MGRTHTIKVRCASWEQLAALVARKLDRGSLSARVPFRARKGQPVTVALELPDDVTLEVEADIAHAAPAADGERSAVILSLRGLGQDILHRLRRRVAEARAFTEPDRQPDRADTEPEPPSEPPAGARLTADELFGDLDLSDDARRKDPLEDGVGSGSH